MKALTLPGLERRERPLWFWYKKGDRRHRLNATHLYSWRGNHVLIKATYGKLRIIYLELEGKYVHSVVFYKRSILLNRKLHVTNK